MVLQFQPKAVYGRQRFYAASEKVRSELSKLMKKERKTFNLEELESLYYLGCDVEIINVQGGKTKLKEILGQG